MSGLVIDRTAGKVTFPKAEAQVKPAKSDVVRVHMDVPANSYKGLANLAARDGFKPNAKTPKGQANQTAAVCRTYINLAIDILLAKRKS